MILQLSFTFKHYKTGKFPVQKMDGQALFKFLNKNISRKLQEMCILTKTIKHVLHLNMFDIQIFKFVWIKIIY